MKKYTTIKDIAKYLGLSTSTVSRALNDSWEINSETKAKVLETAKLLNYRPNLIAQNLQHKSSGVIGLVIPEFTSGFFPRIILGIQDVLYEENYQLLITQSNESLEHELQNLCLLEGNMVEGILLSITREGSNAEEYRRIIDSGIPIVFFNRVCPHTKASKVIVDDRKMAFQAVEHLIKSGCKRIMHLTGPRNLPLTEERKAGYLDALKKYEYKIDENYIVEAGVLMEKGVMAMEKFLLSGYNIPDAIFAFNDPVAIGAMNVIKKNNLRIPDDIALVGFSEDQLASVVDPPLTSVVQPNYEMGKVAAKLLIEQIKSPLKSNLSLVRLDATLNIRASSSR